jgi:2-oxoglutarate/2-oxoacid ferredoxin oxidoreductase subunit alpha
MTPISSKTSEKNSSSLLWKIGGEAGFGIMTTGFDFAKMAARLGYHVADYAEYPSLIRGGHNTYEVHFSEKKVRSSKDPIDILVCLNKDTYEFHKHRLHERSIVLYDRDMFQVHKDEVRAYHVPLKQTLRELNASMVMMNTIALGASIAVLDWPLETFMKMIQQAFGRKGEEVVNINKQLAQIGYDSIKTNYLHVQLLSNASVSKGTSGKAKNVLPRVRSHAKLVMTGNDAFALGAVIGDCHLYVAYPMTPSSAVLTSMAGYAEKTGMIVRHAEDEISVINTAIGASFAGARAACGTSGGGFALMTEAVSLAGVTEVPLVILMGQRPGPATGLPTWTEQGDLMFTVHAGHGEFPKIVLAPGDLEEMYTMAAEAFNLADIYQTPVIVMSDKHLAESHWSISKVAFNLFAKMYRVDRGKIIDKVKKKTYLRYKVTDDGISPMLIPGQKGVFYQGNSYEHGEDGHSIEDSQTRSEQVEKRARKIKTYLKNHFQMPQVFGDIKKAQHVFVGWGSTKGVMLDTIDYFAERGMDLAYIHFSYVYPLDRSRIRKLFEEDSTSSRKDFFLIENNGRGQFGELLRQQTGVDIQKGLFKYDGRQIFIEDVIKFTLKQ